MIFFEVKRHTDKIKEEGKLNIMSTHAEKQELLPSYLSCYLLLFPALWLLAFWNNKDPT